MAAVGRTRVLLTRLLRRLKLSSSTSILLVFTRPTARTTVGAVSPSAVW